MTDHDETIDLPGWLIALNIHKDRDVWVAAVTGDAHGTGNDPTVAREGRTAREAFNAAVDAAEGWTTFALESQP
jgi:hypothetical protein